MAVESTDSLQTHNGRRGSTTTSRRVRNVSATPRRSTLLGNRGSRFAGRHTLLAATLLAVAALALLGAVAFAVFRDRPPGEDSADAGFARDMAVHHGQAVEMAVTVSQRTDDPIIRTIAIDIALTQQAQIGMMTGMLDVWNLPTTGENEPMAWMGDADIAMPGDKGGQVETGDHTMDGRMPGLATAEEKASLLTLPVTEMNEQFLRLMIRHHEGGILMAQEALDRAETDQVRDLARGIITAQHTEIEQMEQMLEQYTDA
jgi:uncharacterized protein (DUF305 family)